MSRTHLTQLLATAGLVACLVGAAFMTGPIRTQRQDLQIERPEGASASIAGQEAWTTLLGAGTGAFRGLIADYLWYRANALKDQGKYHEANALSEAITQLQPSFAQVWVFNAWNMAYNISVATFTPEERWNWVQKGVALLRDKGIPQNPRSVVLYKELNWIFFHKIGESSDDQHWYYKRMLAEEWQEVLGRPAPGETMPQAYERFKPIVEAPEALAAVLAGNPVVAELLQELSRLGFQPDQTLLRQIGRIRMFSGTIDTLVVGVDLSRVPGIDVNLVRLLADQKYAQAWRPLLAYLRKQVLIHHYHMDPAFMLRMMTPEAEGGFAFGALDWRHPGVHSLYWSALGVEVAKGTRSKAKVDIINTYRGVIHSMQKLARTGRVSYYPIEDRLMYRPDSTFIESYIRALERADTDLQRADWLGLSSEQYESGYENFLLDAIVHTYIDGKVETAQQYYKILRDRFGNRPDRVGKYIVPLDDLVLEQFVPNWDRLEVAAAIIDALIVRSISEGLAEDRPEVFLRFIGVAQQIHQKMQEKSLVIPTAERPRLAFLDFPVVVAQTYAGVMQEPFDLVLRGHIWRNTPVDLQQATYDTIKPLITAHAQQVGLDVNRVLPEPPGMADYRKKNPPSRETPPKPEPDTTIERR
ncbi:MAG: hypothetical protein WD042_10060 [Phycisphaeraceae bacterium]